MRQHPVDHHHAPLAAVLAVARHHPRQVLLAHERGAGRGVRAHARERGRVGGRQRERRAQEVRRVAGGGDAGLEDDGGGRGGGGDVRVGGEVGCQGVGGRGGRVEEGGAGDAERGVVQALQLGEVGLVGVPGDEGGRVVDAEGGGEALGGGEGGGEEVREGGHVVDVLVDSQEEDVGVGGGDGGWG